MRPSERLIARLRRMGVEIPEGSTIRRTYAGRCQRSAGAWSWWLAGPRGEDLNLGGYWRVTDLLQQPRLVVDEYEFRHRGDRTVDRYQGERPGLWTIVEPCPGCGGDCDGILRRLAPIVNSD